MIFVFKILYIYIGGEIWWRKNRRCLGCRKILKLGTIREENFFSLENSQIDSWWSKKTRTSIGSPGKEDLGEISVGVHKKAKSGDFKKTSCRLVNLQNAGVFSRN